MPDNEAHDEPQSFVDSEEMAEAYDPNTGDGTPETAPEKLPSATLLERVRSRFSRI